MRIYVAAATRDLDNAKSMMREAQKFGHTITHDWTKSVRKNGRGDPNEVSQEEIAMAAWEDRQGVRKADLFILLWNPHLLGGLIELGFALDRNIPCWIVGEPRWSVFYVLPGNPVRIFTWHRAVVELSGI